MKSSGRFRKAAPIWNGLQKPDSEGFCILFSFSFFRLYFLISSICLFFLHTSSLPLSALSPSIRPLFLCLRSVPNALPFCIHDGGRGLFFPSSTRQRSWSGMYDSRKPVLLWISSVVPVPLASLVFCLMPLPSGEVRLSSAGKSRLSLRSGFDSRHP